ncbi:MAG: hypothetical protein QGG09_10560 [Pirellulaceae bacterium]|nr:hypothetical protein [Pirellulaceae bacterium]
MPRVRVAVQQQALTDMKSRKSVSQTDLDGLLRMLVGNPISQRLAFLGVDRDRENVVFGAVGFRDHRAITSQTLDYAAYSRDYGVLARQVVRGHGLLLWRQGRVGLL